MPIGHDNNHFLFFVQVKFTGGDSDFTLRSCPIAVWISKPLAPLLIVLAEKNLRDFGESKVHGSQATPTCRARKQTTEITETMKQYLGMPLESIDSAMVPESFLC